MLLNTNSINLQDDNVIIDCSYSFTEAVSNLDFPNDIKNNLIILTVRYYSFEDKLHQGQIVINKNLEEDIKSIFKLIEEKRFKVAKVIPIVFYNWSDEKSMLDNNTSAFNYRFIAGTKKLSNHSTGKAIDINPFLNPQVFKDKVYPNSAKYNPKVEGTITADLFLVNEFKKMGWSWGGDWKDSKDYQHFEKLK
ncbi:MAG: M15 family metallopeptidase [Bacteroidetes bacterium]|nr:M15 family metallopeptidase [Bacteroidota bacterium]